MAKRLYVQYCRIDELMDWEPELAKELQQKKYVFKNGVKYKLTPKDYVERIDAFLCAHPEPENPSLSEPHFEKHKAKLIKRNPRFQSSLYDIITEKSIKIP
jgi:hypothetical protein